MFLSIAYMIKVVVYPYVSIYVCLCVCLCVYVCVCITLLTALCSANNQHRVFSIQQTAQTRMKAISPQRYVVHCVWCQATNGIILHSCVSS